MMSWLQFIMSYVSVALVALLYVFVLGIRVDFGWTVYSSLTPFVGPKVAILVAIGLSVFEILVHTIKTLSPAFRRSGTILCAAIIVFVAVVVGLSHHGDALADEEYRDALRVSNESERDHYRAASVHREGHLQDFLIQNRCADEPDERCQSAWDHLQEIRQVQLPAMPSDLGGVERLNQELHQLAGRLDAEWVCYCVLARCQAGRPVRPVNDLTFAARRVLGNMSAPASLMSIGTMIIVVAVHLMLSFARGIGISALAAPPPHPPWDTQSSKSACKPVVATAKPNRAQRRAS